MNFAFVTCSLKIFGNKFHNRSSHSLPARLHYQQIWRSERTLQIWTRTLPYVTFHWGRKAQGNKVCNVLTFHCYSEWLWYYVSTIWIGEEENLQHLAEDYLHLCSNSCISHTKRYSSCDQRRWRKTSGSSLWRWQWQPRRTTIPFRGKCRTLEHFLK